MIPLLSRLVLPFSIVAGASLLLEGYASIGDGFSAGAVVGLGAVAQLAAREHDEAARLVGGRWAWRLVAAGLLLTLLVTIGPVLFAVAPVTHLPSPEAEVARVGVLELHSSVLFDLGVALSVYGAFVGAADRLFPAGREEAP